MTREEPRSIEYFLLCDPEVHPGPYHSSLRLAKGLTGALEPQSVRVTPYHPESLSRLLQMLVAAGRSSADIVLLRHIPSAGLGILLLGWVLRMRRRIFVLQVPTPVSSAGQDWNLRRGRAFRSLSRVLSEIAHPFVYRAPHVIIQYAHERGRMRRIGRDKTVVLTHPVESVTRSMPPQLGPLLQIVGVAGSGKYPGFDRVIAGFAEVQGALAPGSVQLTLVGDPLVLERERELAEELGLARQVRFVGALFGNDLDELLDQATVGLGTLAPHRVGLSVASPLKHRTYLSRGLPFVTAVDDPGLPTHAAWLLRVPASDEPIDVVQLARWAQAIDRHRAVQEMSEWADQQLSAASQARRLLEAVRANAILPRKELLSSRRREVRNGRPARHR